MLWDTIVFVDCSFCILPSIGMSHDELALPSSSRQRMLRVVVVGLRASRISPRLFFARMAVNREEQRAQRFRNHRNGRG